MYKILGLEKSLLKNKYLSDLEYLNNIFDDSYIEIGKSGTIYTKEDEIKYFKNNPNDRNIKIYNYSEEKIDNIYVVHYITKSEADLIYRTSIWKENENIKLYFHQASILKENIELNEY